MNTGNLQRRWSEEKPEIYDKATRHVAMDIRQEDHVGEDGKTIKGFSFVQVQIDEQISYAHIKSELIESGFAQKDEFGLLMNSVSDLLAAISSAKDFPELKSRIDTEDLNEFRKFCEYRKMCADTAKIIVESY